MADVATPTAGQTTRDDLTLFILIAALYGIGSAAAVLIGTDFHQPIPREAPGLVIGRDFLNFWAYGRAAFEASPGRNYDLATYAGYLHSLIGGSANGQSYPGQVWSYPPTIMLIAWPFGRLQYLPALMVWTLGSIVLFVWAMRGWTCDWRLILAGLFAPAAVFGMFSGQFELVIAAGLLTALRLIDRRPVLAGVLIGLLTLKPQVGLFLPVLLLATWRWRVFAVASVTAVVLAGLTGLIWGPDVWRDYVTTGLPNQMLVLNDIVTQSGSFMTTLFVNLRAARLGFEVAWLVQGLVTMAVAIAIAVAFWRRRGPLGPTDIALFLTLSLIGSAYLMIYDTETLVVACLLWLASGVTKRERIVITLIYLLPPIQMVVGAFGLTGSIVVPVAALAVLLRQRYWRST